MSTISNIRVQTLVLMRKFALSNFSFLYKVHILTIFLRHLVHQTRVCSFEDVVFPMFLLYDGHVSPFLEDFVFSRDYLLLPFFVVANVIIFIRSGVAVV